MTVKERLIEFIKYLEIGQSKFEKAVGLSNGYVNNIRKSIQPDTLQRISLIYPELNTGWLMTGDGEMLKNSKKPQTTTDMLQKVERLEKEKEDLLKELEVLKIENRLMKQILGVEGQKIQNSYFKANAG